MRQPNYTNPRWGETLPNPLPPREVTNFMVQLTVQPNLSLSQGQQGPRLGVKPQGGPGSKVRQPTSDVGDLFPP